MACKTSEDGDSISAHLTVTVLAECICHPVLQNKASELSRILEGSIDIGISLFCLYGLLTSLIACVFTDEREEIISCGHRDFIASCYKDRERVLTGQILEGERCSARKEIFDMSARRWGLRMWA